MSANFAAHEATIFSCVRQPPPPLMQLSASSTSSAPSIAKSNCNNQRNGIVSWFAQEKFGGLFHSFSFRKRIAAHRTKFCTITKGQIRSFATNLWIYFQVGQGEIVVQDQLSSLRMNRRKLVNRGWSFE